MITTCLTKHSYFHCDSQCVNNWSWDGVAIQTIFYMTNAKYSVKQKIKILFNCCKVRALHSGRKSERGKKRRNKRENGKRKGERESKSRVQSADHVGASLIALGHGHVPNNSLGTRKQLLRNSCYRATLRVHISCCLSARRAFRVLLWVLNFWIPLCYRVTSSPPGKPSSRRMDLWTRDRAQVDAIKQQEVVHPWLCLWRNKPRCK